MNIILYSIYECPCIFKSLISLRTIYKIPENTVRKQLAGKVWSIIWAVHTVPSLVLDGNNVLETEVEVVASTAIQGI